MKAEASLTAAGWGATIYCGYAGPSPQPSEGLSRGEATFTNDAPRAHAGRGTSPLFLSARVGGSRD